MSSPLSRYRRNPRRHGTTLVETAVVIGACLLFLFAIFEYGRIIMLQQVVTDATREGARYAVANTNTQPTPNLQTYVSNYLAGQPLTVTRFNAFQADPNNNYANIGPWQNAPFAQPIVIQLQASYTPIFPSFNFLKNPVILNAESTMCSEGN